MIFETLGEKKNPAVLIIHGMFCSAKAVKLWAEPLKNDFYIIIPTLNGHYADAPDYISKQNEAAEILLYLKQHGITELALLHGTSMGAEVAFEVCRQSTITIKKCFFDGGPFFHFNPLFRKFMLKKWRAMASVLNSDDPESAAEKLLNSSMIKWMSGNKPEKYRTTLFSMIDKNRKFTEATLHNVNETCYTFEFPEISEEMQKTFFFLYSDNEPAHMSKKNMLKHYPNAEFKDMHNLGHCGFQMSKPNEYAEFIRDFIKK